MCVYGERDVSCIICLYTLQSTIQANYQNSKIRDKAIVGYYSHSEKKLILKMSLDFHDIPHVQPKIMHVLGRCSPPITIYISIYICMYVCMHACMDAWMHGCMDAWMHACMYVCMCMYIYIYICICVFIYKYTFVYMVSPERLFPEKAKRCPNCWSWGGGEHIYIYSDIGDGLVLGLPDYQIFPIRFLQEASCGTGAQR